MKCIFEMNRNVPMRPWLILSSVMVLLCALSIHATPIDLYVYENSDNANTEGLHTWIDLIDGGSYVDFTFHNDSTISSVITDIYFESTAFSSTSLTNGTIVTPQPTGVDFTNSASPPEPAGSIRHFGGEWNGNLFVAGATPPASKNGIGQGESLTIRFNYMNINFNDLQEALSNPTAFRIAQHVQCLPNNKSIWTVTPLPLPSTMTLLVSGLLAVTSGKKVKKNLGWSR